MSSEILPFTLDPLEIGGLEKLVAIPSHDIEGQIRKTKLITQLLHGAPIFKPHDISVGDGTSTFVAESRHPEDFNVPGNQLFTVIIYSHIDTVEGHPNLQDQYVLQKGEKLIAHGVSDMQSSIEQAISLAHTVKVPRGVRTLFAFCPSEETSSAGVKAFIRWLKSEGADFRRMVVASSEIGPLPPTLPGQPHRCIGGRQGALKVQVEVTVNGSSHGAADPSKQADAAKEFLTFLQFLPYVFDLRRQKKLLNTPGTRLPERWIQESVPLSMLLPANTPAGSSGALMQGIWADIKQPQDYSNQVKAVGGYTFKLRLGKTPNRPVEKYIETQKGCVEDIGIANRWNARGVSLALDKHPALTTYVPYRVDPCDERVRAVVRSVYAVMHRDGRQHLQPQIVDGESQADQNCFMEEGIVCVDVPHDGGGEHRGGLRGEPEWVLREHVAAVREVFRYLIQHEAPILAAIFKK